MGKGNGSQPLSDEEEDWEIWMSGNYDEGGRQGMSKDSGSGDMEDRRRSGSGPGREMPERRAVVVDGYYDDVKTTVCGRLAKTQPVHACAGNLIPLRKVSGQVPVSRGWQGSRVDFVVIWLFSTVWPYVFV